MSAFRGRSPRRLNRGTFSDSDPVASFTERAHALTVVALVTPSRNVFVDDQEHGDGSSGREQMDPHRFERIAYVGEARPNLFGPQVIVLPRDPPTVQPRSSNSMTNPTAIRIGSLASSATQTLSGNYVRALTVSEGRRHGASIAAAHSRRGTPRFSDISAPSDRPRPTRRRCRRRD